MKDKFALATKWSLPTGIARDVWSVTATNADGETIEIETRVLLCAAAITTMPKVTRQTFQG